MRMYILWQGVPLLYVPLEVVMSKYYGESERLLGKVFSLANELPNGAIIFLDEVTNATFFPPVNVTSNSAFSLSNFPNEFIIGDLILLFFLNIMSG